MENQYRTIFYTQDKNGILSWRKYDKMDVEDTTLERRIEEAEEELKDNEKLRAYRIMKGTTNDWKMVSYKLKD